MSLPFPQKKFSTRNEEDSSNALADFDPFSQSLLYTDHEIHATSDLDMDQGYDFSYFLETLGRDEHNMNVDQYGHDLPMSDVSQDVVSSTSVDDQDNMTGNFEGWSNYLLDHAGLIYDDTEYDFFDKQII
ncbi:transcription factor MYB28-like [Brassica napus]|uniref:transcription factor MYB28-like n=1 Tax=Brassica napus TaxID=3708 RepID=UPI000BBE94C8|nr:transcription factor MYB28-like [Brassica napus]